MRQEWSMLGTEQAYSGPVLPDHGRVAHNPPHLLLTCADLGQLLVPYVHQHHAAVLTRTDQQAVVIAHMQPGDGALMALDLIKLPCGGGRQQALPNSAGDAGPVAVVTWTTAFFGVAQAQDVYI